MCRGFSFRSDSKIAPRRILVSHIVLDLVFVCAICLESLACHHEQVLKNGSEA